MSTLRFKIVEETFDRKAVTVKAPEVRPDAYKMIDARKAANTIESEQEKVTAYHDELLPYMETIRYHIDKHELMVDNEMWNLPKHRELLFKR